jgi:hypothetical protein
MKLSKVQPRREAAEAAEALETAEIALPVGRGIDVTSAEIPQSLGRPYCGKQDTNFALLATRRNHSGAIEGYRPAEGRSDEVR